MNRLLLLKQRQIYIKALEIFAMYNNLPVLSVSDTEIKRRLQRYAGKNRMSFFRGAMEGAGQKERWKFIDGVFPHWRKVDAAGRVVDGL